MGRLEHVTKLSATEEVLNSTVDAVRSYGAHGLEVLVLWLGRISGDTAEVTHALIPPQESITSEEGVGYLVNSNTLFRINKVLAETELRLIAQVHSHPSAAYHSEADDSYAIVTAEGGFSLVVPNFSDPPSTPSEWAAYRLRGGEWVELADTELKATLHIRVGT